MTQPDDGATAERLRAIADFLPIFEAPGFQFGHWTASVETAPRMFTAGYYTLGDDAMAFVKAAAAHGWVVFGFDWMAWAPTPEAQQLVHDETAMAQATPDQLAHLLTTCIRSDRFSEGALGEAFDSGLLTRILRRAAMLLGEQECVIGSSFQVMRPPECPGTHT